MRHELPYMSQVRRGHCWRVSCLWDAGSSMINPMSTSPTCTSIHLVFTSRTANSPRLYPVWVITNRWSEL